MTRLLISIVCVALGLLPGCESGSDSPATAPAADEPEVRLSRERVARPGSAAPSTSKIICASQKVPAGYVFTQVAYTSTCGKPGSDGYNTLTITTPKDGLSICASTARQQSLPAGYVFTQVANSSTCGKPGSDGYNTLTITTPKDGLSICASTARPQKVPSGYVVTSVSRTAFCGQAGSDGKNTLSIRRASGKSRATKKG